MKSVLSFILCLCVGIGCPVYRNDPEKQIFCCFPNDEKKIALTFDDGPHPKYTEEILSVLEKYGVKATFFAIGENITYYPEAFQKIKEAGHEIGNHTFSHPHLQQKDPKTLEQELERAEEMLSFSNENKLFRPPEGVCSDAVCRVASKMGYTIILWTVDTRDWSHPAPDAIIENVKNNVKSGDIILFHDYIATPSPTPEALTKLIPALLEEGYRFVTVSELIGV